MKIGIIGTGNIGGTLARKLRAAGHDICVANSRGIEGVRPFADEIGAQPVDMSGAVDGMDIIILSIPLPAVATLPKDLFAKVPVGVPVIDAGNYYPGMRDPAIAEIEAGLPESEWVARLIGRPVIKAFNNILAHSLAELGRPKGSLDRLAVAVAGDNPTSMNLVMGLVDEIGFDPVDAGPLASSWRQQPGTPAYCCDDDAVTMREYLAAAVPGRAPARRDALMAKFASFETFPSHNEMVALNRSFMTE
ncbi:3-hydroxyisobutyrate dehydrogenase [Paracoccus liaowanqingii]|uniref:3-hydroxyisobutyrate dehydrogenase n=1 Tax=Paracoccus liaowanqingii TaxID=2560053 RepID=A0A4Z1CHX6_9RHOB|nr:NAD(P)-binding domain-containing protein [Paracoccus liaowanqingii]TGN61970.1 3-hydroxyisobutyrate dehydrogenase [Paracoccus liaowanqingii]